MGIPHDNQLHHVEKDDNDPSGWAIIWQRGINSDEEVLIVYRSAQTDEDHPSHACVSLLIPAWFVTITVVVDTGDDFPDSAIANADRWVRAHLDAIRTHARATIERNMADTDRRAEWRR